MRSLDIGFPSRIGSSDLQVGRSSISPQHSSLPRAFSPASPRVSVNRAVNSNIFNVQQFDRMFKNEVGRISGNDIESVYDDKSKYIGTVVSGMRSGRGEYVYPNGDLYLGMWNNDKFNGVGSYNFTKAGQTYYGDFNNHLMHGKGTLVRNQSDGEIIYDGSWENGLKQGFGTQFYSREPLEYYEGSWFGGNKHGQGLHFRDGNTYRGEWLNGKKHGKGEYQTRDGIVYQGLWNHDILDNGMIRYPRGEGVDIYQGQIVNGLRQGKGRYTHADSQIYEGMYMNDMKHGQGVQKKGNSTYSGSFMNDVRHGYGSYVSGNGDRYQGHFMEGRKQGPNGFYGWKDGSTFRGSFQKDMMWEGTFIDSKDNIPRVVVRGQVQNV